MRHGPGKLYNYTTIILYNVRVRSPALLLSLACSRTGVGSAFGRIYLSVSHGSNTIRHNVHRVNLVILRSFFE